MDDDDDVMAANAPTEVTTRPRSYSCVQLDSRSISDSMDYDEDYADEQDVATVLENLSLEKVGGKLTDVRAGLKVRGSKPAFVSFAVEGTFRRRRVQEDSRQEERRKESPGDRGPARIHEAHDGQSRLLRLLMRVDLIENRSIETHSVEGLQQHQPIGKRRTLLRHEIRLFQEKRLAHRRGWGRVTRLVPDRKWQRQSRPSRRIDRHP